MLIEVCVDRVQSAINAREGGAARLELCQDLALGGTTPSKGLVVQTQRAVDLPIMAMIRPRGGDFCYDDHEFECMIEDIRLMRELKVEGIVVGILTPDGRIDMPRMQRVMQEAAGMEVVCHRAFDMTRDLFETFEDLKKLGITRVLTAGGYNKAPQGIENIKKLIEQNSDITIMPGSGVDASNAKDFEKIGAKEIHLSGKVKVKSKMQYQNPNVSMGSASAEDEYMIEETSREKIAEVCRLF